MDEIIEEFLVESYENLDRLDIELVDLEEHPDSAELLASIFRNVHTIKGTAGFFEFPHLESVAHAGENLLSMLRAGDLHLNQPIATALLHMVDAIRSMLDLIRASGSDGSDPHTALVAELHALQDPNYAGAAPGELAAAAEASLAKDLEEAAAAARAQSSDEGDVHADEASADAEPETAVEDAPVAEAAAEEQSPPAPAEPEAAAPTPEPTPAPAPTPAPTPAKSDSKKGAEPSGGATAPSAVDASIRVDVGLLDRLMNLVGELVLARNQVLQYQANTGDSALQATSQQLDLITTELQEGVMKTRMQPIGNVWAKLPRVVRDLSAQLGKKVKLVMEGEDTELDKTLIEAIKDPLTHIVRNSVDHGLESPEDRIAVGKSEIGTLKLRALHEGGQVIIEIVDDGGGLKLDRIKEKAIASGIITPERAATMSEREASNLIFRPGFSTAAQVTNVSGRGVGMDVVKTNVEKIGGTLEVSTEEGQGTTLTIKIPLTLAIIPALIITCDEARYLIPQINLVEVLHVDSANADASEGDTKVEVAGDAPVLRLRGNLLPIVHLRSVLGLEPAAELDEARGVSIAVLDADEFQFGLIVDQINDTEEIVVKPLSPHLKDLGCFAGTTIMGDGAVSLILDTPGLARMGNIHSGNIPEQEPDSSAEYNRRASTQMVLVCTAGEDRIGIPLNHVNRLEELPKSSVERASGHEVIQYRGDLLRLVHLSSVLGSGYGGGYGYGEEEDNGILQVLVYETESAVLGLIVDSIVDVYECDLSSEDTLNEFRLSGVLGRRVTDLINIEQVVASIDTNSLVTADMGEMP